jgi:hypothetical protein
MDQTEQTLRFARELGELIDRFRREYDLTLASAIGVLEIAKLQIYGDESKYLTKDDVP